MCVSYCILVYHDPTLVLVMGTTKNRLQSPYLYTAQLLNPAIAAHHVDPTIYSASWRSNHFPGSERVLTASMLRYRELLPPAGPGATH